MILNDNKEAQVGILAKIMDFVNALGTDRVKELFSMTDTKAIYQFLVDNFPTD
jgi:mannitol/fructose-specific phosphotransferase system IIA component (Ntr-type)